MKSHRIPRFLTKPWETTNGTFKVFSFKERKICEKNAKYFFAEKDLLTQEEEEFWNKNVETPLADFFSRKINRKGKTIQVENFKHIKAMHLLLISIVERSWKDRPWKSFTFNKQDFEHSMWLWHEKYALLMLNLPFKKQRLLFPETGFFPLLTFNKENNIPSPVQAIPILGNQLLVSMPRTINVDDVFKIARHGNYLVNASVSNVCDKVIIHPDMLKVQSEETLSRALYKLRQANSQIINNCNKLFRLLNRYSFLIQKRDEYPTYQHG